MKILFTEIGSAGVVMDMNSAYSQGTIAQANSYYPSGATFTSMDPLAEQYYHISPYAYCAGDPVNRVDLDGRSTWVINIGNGKYQIAGGNINDKDKNIYVGTFNENKIFTPQYSIGITTSITSFYNSDEKSGLRWSEGSVIDINDKSGEEFLARIISENPPLGYYMMNARTNMPYDFKVTNGTDKPIDDIDIYRGMPVGVNGKGQTIYTSARDVGNIAAGYIAAANGMSWKASRIAFDIYQGEREGISTQNAQYYGYLMGYNNNAVIPKQSDNLLKSIGNFIENAWYYFTK